MVSSTTPIRPTRAAWMPSGGCTSGSTARRRVVTKPVSGGVTTTGTRRDERGYSQGDPARHGFGAGVLRCLGAALRFEHRRDDRLVSIHVRDGGHGDARGLDDVDGLDAH